MMLPAINIYPAEWAAMNVANAGKRYQPSNGDERIIFFEAWCSQCALDPIGQSSNFLDLPGENTCNIAGSAEFYGINEPGYPTEWQYTKSGQPCCTAWTPFPFGPPTLPEPDEFTIDMFNFCDAPDGSEQ